MEQQAMPVFVKVEEYKDVLGLLNTTKEKLTEAKERLDQIIELRNEEDAEIESWRLSIDDIEKKITSMDDSLSEPSQF